MTRNRRALAIDWGRDETLRTLHTVWSHYIQSFAGLREITSPFLSWGLGSHKILSASIKSTLGEAKHEVMILRQEEKNFELLQSVEGKLRVCCLSWYTAESKKRADETSNRQVRELRGENNFDFSPSCATPILRFVHALS